MRFLLTFAVTHTIELDEHQIWPDRIDRPEDPTSDDVRAVIEKDGGAAEVLKEWNLDRERIGLGVTNGAVTKVQSVTLDSVQKVE